jgi:hypothetical protein
MISPDGVNSSCASRVARRALAGQEAEHVLLDLGRRRQGARWHRGL